MKRKIIYTLFLGVLTVMAYIKLSETIVTAHNQSEQSFNAQQHNPALVTKGGRIEAFKTAWDFFFNKPDGTIPVGQIPVQQLTRAQLLAAPNNSVRTILGILP